MQGSRREAIVFLEAMEDPGPGRVEIRTPVLFAYARPRGHAKNGWKPAATGPARASAMAIPVTALAGLKVEYVKRRATESG